MPVPGTIGQLRPKISEMEIGDYIVCKFDATPFTFQLGMTGGYDEIPLRGLDGQASYKKGYFYYIKCARGLLIADRVINHNISWDLLNSIRVIQGKPIIESLIPAMTADNQPSGLVTASSYTNSYVAPWKAFDGKPGATNWYDGWGANDVRGWITYQSTTPIEVQYYGIQSYLATEGGNRAPRTWILYGSNDGQNWIVLDRRNDISWQLGETKWFKIQSPTPCRYHKLDVSKNNGGMYLGIGEIYLTDHPPMLLRSLTGGVAYADENGDKSSTEQGFGAWPTNNEWDKYIVNFPVGKIQPGKTLDDVWHALNTWTLTQDTPVPSLAPSSSRIDRSLNMNYPGALGGIGFPAFNYSATNLGFRPVLEYKE